MKLYYNIDPVLGRVLSNAAVLLGGRVANAVMGLAAIALTARALGLTSFGVLILIHAFAQFLGETVKFQSWQTVLHYGARPLAEGRPADFGKVLRFALALDAIGAVVGVAVGLIATLAFGDRLGLSPEHRPAAALYVLSVVFMVSATPMGLLRLLDRFDVLARQTALVALVRLIGCGIGFVTTASMPAFLIFWAAGVVAGFVYIAWAAWSELKARGLLSGPTWRGGPLTEGMPGAWRFAWSTNLSATVDVAFTHVITLALGALVGPAQAALWRIGRQVADAIAKPARLLTASLYPELARLHAGEGGQAGMWRLARAIGLLAGALGVLLMGLTLGGGEWLLRITMGPQFTQAATLMTWQVGAAVIGLVALPFEPMLVSLGRAGTALWVRLVVCFAYLALLGPVVTHYGALGAAVTLVIASALMALGMFMCVFHNRRNHPQDGADDDQKAQA